MLLRHWLKMLRRWFGLETVKVRPVPQRRPRLGLESLEGRTVPTTKMFLDFGEGFSGGALQMTVDQLADTFANGGIQGPNLTGFFNGGDTLTFSPMSASVTFDYNADGSVNNQDYLDVKAAIIALAQREYAPYDIIVEEAAATNRQDVIDAFTVNAGDPTGENDAYVLMINMSPNIDGVYGISRGSDIGGDNDTEESVLTFCDNSFSFAPVPDADTVVANTTTHEAAHAFSLAHTDNSANADSIILTQSDVIAQFGSAELDTNLLFVPRFPMMLGDGNSDFNVTVNSYDEWANDPDIGLTPGFAEYVTGTGGYDQIRIVPNATGGADVTVDAFRAADFTGLMRSYSYSIRALTNGILVEAGYLNDQIFLDANLATTITVRGMAGFDQLFIDGAGQDGDYQPGAGTTLGYDGATYFSATITAGSMTVNVEEFKTISPALINVQNMGKLTVITPDGADILTIDVPSANTNSITGTTGGVGIIPLVFQNVNTLIIDTGANDGASPNDSVILAAGGFDATGLQNVAIVTGDGADLFTVNAVDYRRPVGGGTFTFDGEAGNDRIVTSADVNFTLNGVGLSSSAGGTIGLTDVEFAQLTGGAGNNTLTLGDWAGGASFNGSAGTDRIVATDDVSFTLTNTLLQRSGLPDVTLQGVEDASLTGGAGANSFDVSGWTGTGTLNGAGGSDLVTSTANANFTLTNTTLTKSPGGALTLVSIENAALTGGAGANTFTISGWTAGGATLNGQGGADVIVASNDVSFTLSDALLGRSGLADVILTSIEVANLTGGASNNTFQVTNWTGTGTLDGQTGTGDTIVASNDLDFGISNVALTRSGLGALTLARMEVANLTGGVSDNAFTVGVWSGTGLLDGGGHVENDVLQTAGDANFALTNTTLSQGPNTINHTGFEKANLAGGAGNNTFTITGWTLGPIAIDGLGGTGDTVAVANDVDFTLSDTQLLRTGLLPITLANVENANLIGGVSANTFNVSAWSGGGALAGDVGTDVVIAVNDVNFSLANTNLSRSGFGTFTLSGIEVANLTGGPNDNSFTINGWTGTGTLDGQGQVDADRLNVVQDTDFTLTDGSFNVPGVGALALVSIEALDVTGGLSANTFTVTDWSGRSTIDGAGHPVGAGDRIVAANDGNFTLSDGLLRRTGKADLTLVNVEVAILTGGVSDNTFDVGDWSGSGVLDGGAQTANDRLIAASNVNFIIADVAMSRTGRGTLQLANLETASLTGGAGDNVFTVGGWTKTLTIAGLGGTDAIAATNNVDFTLTPTALSRTGLPNVILNTVESANLTGGAGANLFTVTAWTGGGVMDGAGGTDRIVATNDVDFTLTDVSLGRGLQPVLALASLEQATLTGGASINQFIVSNWRGTADLNGGEAADAYVLNLVGAGAGITNVNDTGKKGVDGLNVFGTAGNDVFNVTNKRSFVLNEAFSFKRVEDVVLNGGAGNDTFNATGKELDTAIKELTLNGDLGDDRFNVTPSTIPITVDGGDPHLPTRPGDFLFLDLRGGRMTQLLLPNNGSGQFLFLNRASIKFRSIESGFGGGLQDLLP